MLPLTNSFVGVFGAIGLEDAQTILLIQLAWHITCSVVSASAADHHDTLAICKKRLFGADAPEVCGANSEGCSRALGTY